MPAAATLSREYLLKTLRMNMIPSPRVITPGPATVFPIAFETSSGIAAVRSLKEVRSRTWTGGFFREIVPVRETFAVRVDGYSAASPEKSLDKETAPIATRAAYCLGFDAAKIEIGIGPGGPLVLDVTKAPPSGLACGVLVPDSPVPAAHTLALPRFLGARAEYLRVDPATGEPFHQFYSVDLSPDGKATFPADAETDVPIWISSPMPFPEMPLTTRLRFSGAPLVSFVRRLDWTIAVLSMLASPAEEARERHATDEGLLGSIRIVDEGFEYQSLPSLLWNPPILRAVLAKVDAICSGAGIEAPASLVTLEDRYKAQKAYYNCDKEYFASSTDGGAGNGFDPIDFEPLDFRLAWGLRTAGSPAASPAVASISAGAGLPPSTGPHALPILGIMSPAEEGPRRFGIETDRFRELLKAASDRGVTAYVFFPSPWAGKGWFYRDRRGWFEASAPLPDVVYDRHIPDVLPAGTILDVALKFQDAHPTVQFVNSLPFVRACRDKFMAHRLLSTDPFVARYLPETILAEDPEVVTGFAANRRRTYVKLRGGTGSRGLVLVERLDSGAYKVTKRQEPGEASVMDANGLMEMLRDMITPGRYIAQDGIDLARAPGLGEVFEVRVVCQKGGAGVWLRTGMVCRLNPMQGRFMIPREELHLKTDDLLGQIFPGRVAAIKEEAREIARRIPPIIEEGSGPGGEMSVDLGIDTDGRPHLIEVNSKPATLFRDIAAFEIRRLSLRRIVNYAIRLFEST